MDAPRFDLEELLRHRAALEAIARALVPDRHRAEDLVQEAYLAALSRRPDDVRSPGAWLAGVVRRLALQESRRDARRVRRERAVASGEDETAAAEREQRFAALRAIVAELHALDEPYRSTLLMRYFEGLPPRPFVPAD